MTKFDRFTDELLDFFWERSPVSATLTGIHRYDYEMDNFSREYIDETNKKTKEYLRELERFKRGELSDDEYIDWKLVKNNLDWSIRQYEEVRVWQKNPSVYLQYCILGLFVMFVRDFAPFEERAVAFLARMQKIPRFLAQAKRNLRNSPAEFTKLAIEMTDGVILFLKGVVPQLAQKVPALKRDLEKSLPKVTEAFYEFASFLKNEYLPRSKGEFAVGRRLFNLQLEKNHLLPFNAGEILEIGKMAKSSTETELKKLSRKIVRNKDWWEVVEKLKDENPPRSKLMETYKRAMESARDFVKSKHLVTIPPGEGLTVIPTPPFSRPTIPYAAYMAPAPFESKQQGFFYVTTIEPGTPEKIKKAMIRGHSIYGIPITALHEGYPGHHLQLVLANRAKRTMRKIFESTVFAEGWALYCEEMMHDQGFYTDPRTRLLKLKDQLWRACRAIIDVGLHTGKMSFQQAVDMLVNEAKLERIHAEKEVVRYTETPTQPMSYLIGKKQILELRRDYQKKMGRKFDLAKFHNQLLSFGTIPVVLVREAMGL